MVHGGAITAAHALRHMRDGVEQSATVATLPAKGMSLLRCSLQEERTGSLALSREAPFADRPPRALGHIHEHAGLELLIFLL